MPIQIVESPEAGSDAAMDGIALEERLSEAERQERVPILISSEASRMLDHDLRRYCNRELNGRSYLIAGHRGAGKTTMILNAVQRALHGHLHEKLQMRPLLVPLLGPSLLPDENDAANATDAKNAAASSDNTQSNKPTTEAEAAKDEKERETATGMQHVLKQITLALFRALARELTRAYRRQVQIRAWRDQGQVAELFELAAQLELELDEYPGPSRLRYYWRRLRVLNSGVLLPRRWPWPDQGMRELVALCSACEAYRRISGTLSRKDQSKSLSEDKAERKIEWSPTGKDLLAPLIALLTGGAAYAGVLAGSRSHPVIAALAGLLAALGTSLIMKRSSTVARERSAAREDLFLPDLSVATLDRVLPVLIDRIRSAGLAPIFMVDELDKVTFLSTRMPQMVRRLKKLVAENAFFCFLTDRSYFEDMCQRTRDMPYSIEYTYYTNQLFVIFSHDDLHEYLGKLLQLSSPGAEADSFRNPFTLSPGPPPPVPPPNADRISLDEQSDHPILPFILLHAAQMHSFDLRRQLAFIRDDNGCVGLEPGLVRSRPRYRFELMIQVAIELILDDDDMQSELDRQPAFRRLAHDALYHVTREWDSGKLEFDLGSDEDHEACFKKYLTARMDTDPQPTKPDTVTPQLDIMDTDLEFLLQKVRELAGLLCDPIKLLKRAKDASFPQVVLDAIPHKPPLAPLLIAVPGKAHVYRWNFHRSGRPVRVAGAAPLRIEWKDDLSFVTQFDKAIAELTKGAVDPSTLSSQFGIIPTSPAWSDVQRAVSRLSRADSDQGYPEQEPDIAVLADYARLIKGSARSIALSLYCASILGKLGPEGTHEFTSGLGLMVMAFRFRESPEAATFAVLSSLFDQIQGRFPPDSPPTPKAVLNGTETIKGWGDWITESTEITKQKISDAKQELERSKEESWNALLKRLTTAPHYPLGLDDLICALWKRGPFSILQIELDSMTAWQWSAGFAYAVLGRSSLEGESAPPLWLAPVALGKLGFSSYLATLAEAHGSDNLTKILVGDRTQETRLDWGLLIEHSLRAHASVPVLIVTSSADCVAARWLPSRLGATLVLDTALLVDLLRKLEPVREDFRHWLNVSRLVFDLTAAPVSQKLGAMAISSSFSSQGGNVTLPEDRDQMRIRRFFGFESPQPDNPIVLLLRDRPSPDFDLPYVYRPIVAPQNLTDVLDSIGVVRPSKDALVQSDVAGPHPKSKRRIRR